MPQIRHVTSNDLCVLACVERSPAWEEVYREGRRQQLHRSSTPIVVTSSNAVTALSTSGLPKYSSTIIMDANVQVNSNNRDCFYLLKEYKQQYNCVKNCIFDIFNVLFFLIKLSAKVTGHMMINKLLKEQFTKKWKLCDHLLTLL